MIACCTHLDNAGHEARIQSARLILETIERIRYRWTPQYTPGMRLEDDSQKVPVFLAGDFNSSPEQEAYLEMKHSNLMSDIYRSVQAENRYGEEITFTGFHKDQDPEDHDRIDFIWLGPKEAVVEQTGDFERPSNFAFARQDPWWDVQGYAALPNVFEDGIYNSDHRAVVGDVVLHG